MSFKAKLRQLKFWAGNRFRLPLRKNPVERAREAALKHCRKIKYSRRADGKFVLETLWFKKAMQIAWKNNEAANCIIGTLQNRGRREGLVGAEISRAGTIETIPLVTAMNALLLAADGKYLKSWVQDLLE